MTINDPNFAGVAADQLVAFVHGHGRSVAASRTVCEAIRVTLFLGAEDEVERNMRQRLIDRRKELNLSRGEVARRLVDHGHSAFLSADRRLIAKIERGERRLRYAEQELYLQALELVSKEQRAEFREALGVPNQHAEIAGATAPPLKLTDDEQAQLRGRLGIPPG
jgi:transcriptional regulator with XRE-family HTH domain